MSARPKRTLPAPARSNLDSYFALLAGLFLALGLVKWGNPVILDSKIEPPQNLLELLFQSWPTQWGYWLALPLMLTGCVVALRAAADPSPPGAGAAGPRPKFLRWAPLLPLAWLGWQGLSALQTVDSGLTAVTLRHFVACTAFFYLGYFGLRKPENLRLIWVCLALGLFCILRAGFEQHFGGLEETRRYIYKDPHWRELPVEFLKKVASNRIYGPLVSPNTLAGAILLLLPISISFLWISSERLSKPLRALIILVPGAAGAACLFWSGSKAGWLVAVVIGMVALWHSPLGGLWKRWLIYGLLILGLAGFAVRYAGFFQRGSTSVVARFDYWRAAVTTAAGHPILGTGPGTFFSEYRRIKPPDAEMTRLVHNDYLQQACDSGIPGFLAFGALIVGTLLLLHRDIKRRFDLMRFAVWLGLLGVSLHSLVDFHLYIPAMAWPVFFLLGWAGRTSRLSTAPTVSVTTRTKPVC